MDPEAKNQFPKHIDPQNAPNLLASSGALSQQTNFFRSCSLCADGAMALTTSEHRTIDLFSLPFDLDATEDTMITPAKSFTQSESILGTLWYPTAIPENPSTFCFLASVRECPVKLLDAFDGRLRASYRIVDHRERQIAPHSMIFNNTASKLYCGFQDAIEVFDVNYPGEGERILTTPSKKSKSGLKGIISSLAFCPDYSDLYAAGTFSSSLVLFAESSPAEVIQWLRGVKGPVTQVKFNPMRPHLVYATSRQTNAILSWDIRGDTSIPIQEFERCGLTNQRLTFDIDVYGAMMVTGDKDGDILCFDLDGEIPEKPSVKFKAHHDAVAATVLHPLEPKLISVSGSRHFDDDMSGQWLDSSSTEEDSDSSSMTRTRKLNPVSRDSSLKLWGFQTKEDAGSQPEQETSVTRARSEDE